MAKIFIVGSVGSGKTTLAKQLSKQINIPWYELDNIVYSNTEMNRIKRSADEQLALIDQIDQYPSWIFEGVDRTSYRLLYDRADIIIFINQPIWKRRVLILHRFIKQKLGIEHCHYKSNLKMLFMMYKWTNDFENNMDLFNDILKPYEHKLLRIGMRRK